uniref:Uncharacterized protein n=1 Tax=Ananas comosus var. bracteatus TaxID=296719 RepID=A0A6V7P2Z6_ANACO|nr:unnamed protein product [Ananas comosus var. bracteatus]
MDDDDTHKERSIERKQGEVVVVIQTGAAAAAAAKSAPTSSANVEGFEDSAPKSSPPRDGNPPRRPRALESTPDPQSRNPNPPQIHLQAQIPLRRAPSPLLRGGGGPDPELDLPKP